MIVFCIEGSGASSGEYPLTSAVKTAIKDYIYDPEFKELANSTLLIRNKKEFELYTFTPSHFSKKCELMTGVASRHKSNRFLIVAKSLGAYRLYKHRSDLSSILNCSSNRTAIVTIDSHAPFWLCGPKNPIDGRWTIKHNIKAWNVFQLKRYPRGAIVAGIININAGRTTHSRIAESPPAVRSYREAVRWLEVV